MIGKIIVKIVVFGILISSKSYADFEWFHHYDYRTAKRFYLHPYLNYDFSLKWYDVVEKNKFTQTQFRMNIGSVSLNQLNTEIECRLNQKLNQKVWFRMQYKKEQKQENPISYNDVLLGFDYLLTENFSFFIAANPDFDKSKVNAHYGIMISQPGNQEFYFRTSFEQVQFVYDYKNELEGKTTQNPYQINWKTRFGKSNRWFYSEGFWQRAFKRKYPESEAHTLMKHSAKKDYLLFKMYQKFASHWLAQSGITYRKFWEEKIHDSFYLSYYKRIVQIALRNEYKKKDFSYRPEFRYLYHFSKRTAKSQEFSERTKTIREELLYGLFVARTKHKNQFEIGYLASQFWVGEKASNKDFYREQKALFAWTYLFSENTMLRLSVSHVFTIHGFGGGNMQLITHF